MNKTVLLSLSSLLILLSATNCKKKSSEEFVKNFGKTVCYKMTDCMAESMKDIPEAQRAMIMDKMPTREKCDEKAAQPQAKDQKPIEISASEQAIGQKCLDEMAKASCQDMRQGIPSCQEFSEIIRKKQEG